MEKVGKSLCCMAKGVCICRLNMRGNSNNAAQAGMAQQLQKAPLMNLLASECAAGYRSQPLLVSVTLASTGLL
jgi:hypothetical protein